MSHGPYQKKYLVSPAEMERLVKHYKGTLMENSRLTSAKDFKHGAYLDVVLGGNVRFRE